MRPQCPSRVLALALLVLPLAAQHGDGGADVTTGAALLEQVRGGGVIYDNEFRRGDSGALEVRNIAITGDPDLPRWTPLVAPSMLGYGNLGPVGLLAVLSQAPTGLLGMTDAELHFAALGRSADSVALRQGLALPLPAFDGARGRAEMLDRMLALDVLARRGHRQALPEVTRLAADAAAPAALRARARRTAAVLRGEPAERRPLRPEELRLPPTYDVGLFVDHGRLPSLAWLTGTARRMGMLVTARRIAMAGGAVSAPARNGGQLMADMVCEVPFELVRRCGDMRIDQSCAVLNLRADPSPPAILWTASGAFDAARFAAADDVLQAGPETCEVGPEVLYVSTDGAAGMPRPALAEELLRDTGAAVRVLLPATSKVWALAPARALGAELRVVFDDGCRLELEVATRDRAGAEEWIEQGRALLGTFDAPAIERFERLYGADAAALLRQVLAVDLAAGDSGATATVTIRDFDTARLRRLAEAQAERL